MNQESGQLVLLIEDNEGDAFLMKRGLLSLGDEIAPGLRVVHHAGAQAALGWLELNVPSLIIMDWYMPGLDGPMLLETITSRTDVPLIVMSGQEELRLDEDREACFIPKPDSLRELREVFRAIGDRYLRVGARI